jgi:predicted Kef-type K+ transport protein
MWLPTRDQVNAAARHAASFAGGAILVFGLSTKINVETVNQIIAATGTVVNDMIVLAGLISPLVAGYFASKSASPTSQAAAVAATGAKVVTTPEIAAAVPSPNVVSETEAKVVPK